MVLGNSRRGGERARQEECNKHEIANVYDDESAIVL